MKSEIKKNLSTLKTLSQKCVEIDAMIIEYSIDNPMSVR